MGTPGGQPLGMGVTGKKQVHGWPRRCLTSCFPPGKLTEVSAIDFFAEMQGAGHDVSEWGNPPGDRYGRHSHAYRKIICCLEGSIVFHTPSGDYGLSSGDRLVLEPGTEHSATVGPKGVRCAEVHIPVG
jgi:quercetin dioxygenase-like cupin family protein